MIYPFLNSFLLLFFKGFLEKYVTNKFLYYEKDFIRASAAAKKAATRGPLRDPTRQHTKSTSTSLCPIGIRTTSDVEDCANRQVRKIVTATHSKVHGNRITMWYVYPVLQFAVFHHKHP